MLSSSIENPSETCHSLLQPKSIYVFGPFLGGLGHRMLSGLSIWVRPLVLCGVPPILAVTSLIPFLPPLSFCPLGGGEGLKVAIASLVFEGYPVTQGALLSLGWCA